MEPLDIWKKPVEKADTEDPNNEKRIFNLRKSTSYYSGETNFVETVEDANAIVDLANQRPLSHIGIDTEFQYNRPGIPINKRSTRYDPFSIVPLLLSLAMVEPTDNGKVRIYNFVVDLRSEEVLPPLNELFSLPVTLTAHYAKVEIFCLLKLGLTLPNTIWDTWTFEKVLSLGKNNPKYKIPKNATDQEEIQCQEDIKETAALSLSLTSTAVRYGISHAMASAKKHLQKSFLNHKPEAPFNQEQIEYAAEDAIIAAKIYPAQIQQAVQHDLLQHCVNIEMPWVVTNAKIEWAGVRIDTVKRDLAVEQINKIKVQLERQLKEKYGIDNARSHTQLKDFFSKCGMLDSFMKCGKVCFDKEQLKQNVDLHPIIPLLREIKKASDLLADKMLSSEFISVDGRIRAQHQQLGADTGRQSTRWPNIMGLNKVLRPMVIPEKGYGIGEVDYNQVEIGVAAAVYGDDELIQMFNSGDVYSSMAQLFFADKINEADRLISGEEFKKQHKNLRSQMKICTLGLLYGITPTGLAPKLGTTKTEAAKMQKVFMAMFPQLEAAINKAIECGAIRGYASTISGLKRFRGSTKQITSWEQNWLSNLPVQGSAAVVFKMAGNRLHKLYQQYDARIIIPMHDAFIFESPLDNFQAVADLTDNVMCQTLTECFPILKPQAELNISDPTCWNKDGKADELETWVTDCNKMMQDI